MDKILCFSLCLCVFWCEVLANKTELNLKQTIKQDLRTELEQLYTRQNIKSLRNEITELNQAGIGRNESLPIFTKWTPWSRCEDCLQRRMKKCISPKCRRSELYEERPCARRRCKRRRRRKLDEDFRIVHVDESMQRARTSRTRIWSKWSKWSKCTKQCRTFRVRVCKKPERCKKRKQRQSAFCYHDNTKCEQYVLNLLDMSNNRRVTYEEGNRYQYNNQENQGSQIHTYRPPKKCGRARKKTKMLKIIGGTEAKKYKWPWHVAVINRYREVFCAGTLIAPRWIVTAGHCVRSFLKVRLNEHDLSAVDGRELEMTVQKMFLHPRFNHQTVDNDIALLRLPRGVRIPPVCLPSAQPETKELCSIMGWGKLNSSDEYGSTKLHEAKIPVVDWDTCTRAYKRYVLTPNMFCAGWQSGAADTCAGDSGGGLMCPPKKGKRTKGKGYSIQGITSFGDGCGRKNKYGIYTMVYNYLGWINYITETYS